MKVKWYFRIMQLSGFAITMLVGICLFIIFRTIALKSQLEDREYSLRGHVSMMLLQQRTKTDEHIRLASELMMDPLINRAMPMDMTSARLVGEEKYYDAVVNIVPQRFIENFPGLSVRGNSLIPNHDGHLVMLFGDDAVHKWAEASENGLYFSNIDRGDKQQTRKFKPELLPLTRPLSNFDEEAVVLAVVNDTFAIKEMEFTPDYNISIWLADEKSAPAFIEDMRPRFPSAYFSDNTARVKTIGRVLQLELERLLTLAGVCFAVICVVSFFGYRRSRKTNI